MKMPANMPSSVFFCLLQPSGTKPQASDSTRPQGCSTAPPANDLFLERMSCKMALGQVTCKMYVAVILPQRPSDLYEAWKLNVLELKVLPASVKAVTATAMEGCKPSAFGIQKPRLQACWATYLPHIRITGSRNFASHSSSCAAINNTHNPFSHQGYL